MSWEVIYGARSRVLREHGDISEDGAALEQGLLVLVTVAVAGLVVERFAEGLLTPHPLPFFTVLIGAAVTPNKPDPVLPPLLTLWRACRVCVCRIGAARDICDTTCEVVVSKVILLDYLAKQHKI